MRRRLEKRRRAPQAPAGPRKRSTSPRDPNLELWEAHGQSSTHRNEENQGTSTNLTGALISLISAILGAVVGGNITAQSSFAVLEKQVKENARADMRPGRQAKFLAFSNAAEDVIAAQTSSYRAAWECHSKKSGDLRSNSGYLPDPSTKAMSTEQRRSIVARSALTCMPGTKSAYSKALNKLANNANSLSQISEPDLLNNASEFVRGLLTVEQLQKSFLKAAEYRYNLDLKKHNSEGIGGISGEDDGRCGKPFDGEEAEDPILEWAIPEIPPGEEKTRRVRLGFPAGSGGMATEICLSRSLPYPRAGQPGYVDTTVIEKNLNELRADACASLYSTDRGCVLKVTVPPRDDGFPHLDYDGHPITWE